MKPTIHGWPFSPFVRAVRMALAEKGVDYDLVAMTPGDVTPDFRTRLSPFGRIPVVQHEGRTLIETPAILGYIDAAFEGPRLRPSNAGEAAISDMILHTAANYFYPTGVMGVFFGEAYVKANGGTPDLNAVEAAADASAPFLAFLEKHIAGAFVSGAAVSAGDLIAAPMIHNFSLSSVGARRLAAYPAVSGWFNHISGHPSFIATEEPIPLFGL